MAEDDEQFEQRRSIPQSDLDFNLMTTDPEWGRASVDMDFKEWLSYYTSQKDKNGQDEIVKKNLWGRLNYYRRDIRLANLSKWDEIPYVQYYLDLAGDFLAADMIEPFLICLSRAATVLELSQSKNGFLRRRMNTFTQEQFKTEMEPKKKSMWGGSKQEPGA